MTELLVTSLLNGVVYGLMLFMLSAGLTLIFSMMGVLNLAHGSFFMLGAYFSYQFSKWVGFWPALVLAPLVCGLLGAAVERWGLRYAHRNGHVSELLLTFGLIYIIEELVVMAWGRDPVNNQVPAQIDFAAFTYFSTSFPAYKVLMIVITIAMFIALFWLLKRTRVGLVIQAALTHPEMASMLGHDVPKVFTGVFAFGSALAGLAGVIGGFALLTAPTMAASVGLIVFVVVIVGGLGSLGGALLASLIIGVLQTLSVTVDAPLGALWGANAASSGVSSVKLSELAPMIPYLLMVVMLVFRPRGLFGTREA